MFPKGSTSFNNAKLIAPDQIWELPQCWS